MQESNILAIASIHATILGTIVAAILIIVSLVGDKKLSLLQDLIQTHRKVDALFPSDWRIPMFSNKDDPNLNAELRDVRHRLISSVTIASMGPLGCPTPICPTPDKFGETIVLGLASLVTHYPLLSSTRYLSGGRIEDAIKDTSSEFYKKWLEDTRQTLSSLRELENYRGDMLHSVQAYQDLLRGPNKEAVERQEEQNKGLKKEAVVLDKAIDLLHDSDPKKAELRLKESKLLRDIRENESLTAPNYVNIVGHILQTLADARGVIDEVMPQFTLLKHYGKMFSYGLLIVILASMFLTFLFGIALPMTHKFHGLCDAHWCPYIIYIIIPLLCHLLTAACTWAMMWKSVN